MMDLFYRPPLSVHSMDSRPSDELQRHKKNSLPSGIPRNLSFENIVNGELCFPCRLRDFMNYLRFVEHSVENLKFYLWWKDYSKRFESLPLQDRMKSPVYVEENTTSKGGLAAKYAVNHTLDIRNNPLDPRARQPFRAEVGRICSLFILPGSPLELNLSTRDRNLTLQALQYTTHPSAFLKALRSAEESMRFQSHPNFVLRLLEGSNPERISFGRAVGIVLGLVGLALCLALILSQAPRLFRILPSILVGAGALLIVNSRRNICLRLFPSAHRKLNVWDDPDEFAVDMAPGCCREPVQVCTSLDNVEKQEYHTHKPQLSLSDRIRSPSANFLANFDALLGFNSQQPTHVYEKPEPSPRMDQFGEESFLKRTLALRKRIRDEEDVKVHHVMVFQHASVFCTTVLFICLTTFPLPRFGYF